MRDSGHIFYQDEYETQYLVDWETVKGDIDITTETRQPYVWGEKASGFLKHKILYRKGIITIIRQIIRPLDDGYMIIAEGSSQYIDYIRMNYPCGGGPTDPFRYHCDSAVLSDVECRVTIGSRWADPAEDDEDMVWGDLDADGSPADPTTTEDQEILAWMDVWPLLP